MKAASGHRSIRRRLAASMAALVSGCVLLVLLFAYVGAIASHRGDLDREIREMAERLAEMHRAGGEEGLAQEIEDPRNHLWLYSVWSSEEHVARAGNVTPPPEAQVAGGDPASFWVEGRYVRGVAVEVGHGDSLFVGRDVTPQLLFERRLLIASLGAGAVVIALAVATGLWTSRRLVGRVESTKRTVVSILKGRRLERLPVDPRGDEFDDLAANFNELLDENERLLARIREVTNNIAHDLRTPLAHVRSHLEAALARPRDAERDEATLHEALAETNGLLATFQSLLGIARIESGVVRDEMADVDLAGVAADAVELYGPVAEDAELVLELHADAPAPVRGNRHLLSQALVNLIENAIKFSPPGSTIDVRARRIDGGEGQEGGAELRVADHGPGIPAEEREHVLGRFTRLDAAREKPGSGLGLSLVSAVAELHGAELSLADNDPAGLLVTLRFPPLPEPRPLP